MNAEPSGDELERRKGQGKRREAEMRILTERSEPRPRAEDREPKGSLAMKESFEQYCQRLRREAERLAQEAEMRQCMERIRALSFDPAVQGLENVRSNLSPQAALWVRVRWVFVGLVTGAALAVAFFWVWQLNY